MLGFGMPEPRRIEASNESTSSLSMKKDFGEMAHIRSNPYLYCDQSDKEIAFGPTQCHLITIVNLFKCARCILSIGYFLQPSELT